VASQDNQILDVKTDSLSSSAGYQENHFFPDKVNNQVNIFQFVPMNMKNQMKLEELKVTTTAPQHFGNMSSRPWTSTKRFGFGPKNAIGTNLILKTHDTSVQSKLEKIREQVLQ
jgi:hypothetical protein